jgi:3'(2'), 5'-bisphosphate nucleotidase
MNASPDMIVPDQHLVDRIVDLSRHAGAEILARYATAAQATAFKADGSPLTEADLASDRIIRDGLRALTPSLPVLSEESAEVSFAERSRWTAHWLVDPLDGTKEFLARSGEFTVNIALIARGRPVFGVVYAPALNLVYAGVIGTGAWRFEMHGAAQTIGVRRNAQHPVRIVGSRSHQDAALDPFLARLGAHDFVPMGSSLKFCLVAEGSADVYPRFGPTSIWDTAAAQAVVEAAGGRVVEIGSGSDLSYAARESTLNPGFIVFGDTERDWLALLQSPR